MKKTNLKVKSLAVILSLTIGATSLTACGKKITPTNDNLDTSLNFSESLDKPVLSEKELQDVISEYTKALTTYEVHYKYQDFFLAQDDLKQIINHAAFEKLQSSCQKQIQLNSQEDIEQAINELQNQILNNSGGDVVLYKDEQKEIILSDILERALKNIFLHSSNNLVEDYCLLENAKIIIDNENEDDYLTGVYQRSDNSIYLYNQNILDMAINNYEQYIDIVTKVLEHEINHLRQYVCDCHKKYFSSIDYLTNNYVSSDNVVTFLLEASAESSLYNQNIDYNKNLDYSYEMLRTIEEELFLINLPSKNLNAYYDAIFNSSLSDLFAFFNLQYEQDIKDFYSILYTLDTMDGRTNLADILKQTTDEELYKKLNYNYRAGIFKLGLKNLLNYTIQNELPIDENICLFNLLKKEVCHSAYTTRIASDGSIAKDYDPDLIKDIISLEDIYYHFLLDYYQITENQYKVLEQKIFMLEEDSVNKTIANKYNLIKRFYKYDHLNDGYSDYEEIKNNNVDVLNPSLKLIK